MTTQKPDDDRLAEIKTHWEGTLPLQEFVHNAENDVPWLIDEVERLRAVVSLLESEDGQ